ncbi:MAG: hypothetical protein D3910_16685, partial [Candidatus Electrothrix sp. ATG2]|nr:hypothetical protein [Candidatus Electrothrix sp. ATG2]
MSFAKQHGVVKKIKKFLANLLRSPKEAVPSPEHNDQEALAGGDKENTPHQEASTQQTISEERPSSGADLGDMEQWFPSASDDDRETCKQKEPEDAPNDDLITGGVYAVQEQEDGPYQLAKVIYVEEQVVHVLCFAERPDQLP